MDFEARDTLPDHTVAKPLELSVEALVKGSGEELSAPVALRYESADRLGGVEEGDWWGLGRDLGRLCLLPGCCLLGFLGDLNSPLLPYVYIGNWKLNDPSHHSSGKIRRRRRRRRRKIIIRKRRRRRRLERPFVLIPFVFAFVNLNQCV